MKILFLKPKKVLIRKAPKKKLPATPFWLASAYISDHTVCAILFFNKGSLSERYVLDNPWIEDHALALPVDEDVRDFYNISGTPQWIWFINGKQCRQLTGFASEPEVQEMFARINKVLECTESEK